MSKTVKIFQYIAISILFIGLLALFVVEFKSLFFDYVFESIYTLSEDYKTIAAAREYIIDYIEDETDIHRSLIINIFNKISPLTKDYAKKMLLFRQIELYSYILIFLATFIIIAGIVYFLLFKKDETIPHLTNNDTSISVDTIAKNLRIKANSLKEQSNIILLLIIICCAGGFYFFYNAEDIVSTEIQEDIMRDMRNSMEEIGKAVKVLNEELTRTMDRLSQDVITPEIAKALSEVQKDKLSQELSKAINLPVQAQMIIAENKNALISSIVVRSGSMLIIIFIVLILVPAYRYCQRLASFYEARSDALLMVGIQDIPVLISLLNSFSPDFIGFDNPTKELLNNIREMKGIFEK